MALVAAAVAGRGVADDVFRDDFERGDLARWSSAVGFVPPTVARYSDLDLRDPHLFVAPLPFTCVDVTDSSLIPGVPAFNPSLATAITTDGDADGLLDLSSLLLFRPLATTGTGLRVDLASGSCTAPIETTSCAADLASSPTVTTYDDAASGTCLAPGAGTTSGYSPAIVAPAGPCFATAESTIALDLQGTPVTLAHARLAARFAGAAPLALADGLLAGFLSEADADAILLPADFPLVGGQPLSILLPGGTGNCSSHDDRDTVDGVSGWWFYFAFTAGEVPYTSP